eukprot:TRINITY_DN784_c0_g1_i1.p1 TRINITY_DN784_c0_g1~~TRINITY_DN784_c0_g1_i1.p1  ORF type:complete len:587 (+),score=172.38 TRINITY_DN784_c0_g1_i1:34-1761(+)
MQQMQQMQFMNPQQQQQMLSGHAVYPQPNGIGAQQAAGSDLFPSLAGSQSSTGGTNSQEDLVITSDSLLILHAKDLLDEISKRYQSHELELDEIRERCAPMWAEASPIPPERSLLREIHLELRRMYRDNGVLLKRLRRLTNFQVLIADHLHASRAIGHRIQIQQLTIELIRKAIAAVVNPTKRRPGVGMVIVDSPILQVVFKGKYIEETLNVLLLAEGPERHLIADPAKISRIHAYLISEDMQYGKDVAALENYEGELDVKSRIASFQHLKVGTSTRMTAVHIQFSLTINPNPGLNPASGVSKQASAHLIQSPKTKGKENRDSKGPNGVGIGIGVISNISYPLIVITNESQWCEAAGKLVVSDAFAGQDEVPWPVFANVLHHHFLKATRQDSSKPMRTLTPHEIKSFHAKFFGRSDLVTQKQALVFWSWFGQVTQSIRFKRHINSLWYSGLIYGLITKDESISLLQAHPEGTFIIRFSESCGGLFAIAFVASNSANPSDRIKHYLVKAEDTGSQKTLPDFLHEKPALKFLLQLDIDSADGRLVSTPKNEVLCQYFKKTKRTPTSRIGEKGKIQII